MILTIILVFCLTGPASVSGVSVYNVTKNGFNVWFYPVTIVPTISTYYIIKYNEQTINTSETKLFIPAWNPLETEYNISVAYRTTKSSDFSSEISSSKCLFRSILNDIRNSKVFCCPWF